MNDDIWEQRKAIWSQRRAELLAKKNEPEQPAPLLVSFPEEEPVETIQERAKPVRVIRTASENLNTTPIPVFAKQKLMPTYNMQERKYNKQ